MKFSIVQDNKVQVKSGDKTIVLEIVASFGYGHDPDKAAKDLVSKLSNMKEAIRHEEDQWYLSHSYRSKK